MTTNELWTLSIAAYAAVVSTFVLGWDAYKWLHSGPKITAYARANMLVVGGPVNQSDKKFIAVTATNIGDRSTKITNLAAQYYDNWFDAYFRKSKAQKNLIVGSPSQAQVLPYTFPAGDQWIGLANQDAEMERMIGEGYLFMVVYVSTSDKGYRAKVRKTGLST